MIGQTVSHYKIVEKLGQGGMGVVYKAEDLTLDRFVALKFLPRETRGTEKARAAKKRFVQEAKAASSLEHPNICTIHEIDETPDGDTFIVMPAYEGQPLDKRLEEGPLEIGEAIDIMHQIAAGLAKAHAKGIVHRDIKPANIWLTPDNQAIVLDFGLATLSGDSKLTKAGSTHGAVSYLSPQQAKGEEVDVRSDVFSLGVVLYELVTGRLPFEGDVDTAILYGIANLEAPPLSKYKDHIPVELEQIVAMALEKIPENRYLHAGELKDDLEVFSVDLALEKKLPIHAQRRQLTVSHNMRHLITVSLATLAIVCVIIAAGYLLQHESFLSGEALALAVLDFHDLATPNDPAVAAGMSGLVHVGLVESSPIRVINSEYLCDLRRRLFDTARGPIEESQALEVARESGATMLLSGQMGRSGASSYVTWRLVDVASGRTLSARRVEGTNQVLIADEIIAAVLPLLAEETGVGAPPSPPSVGVLTTTSAEAYRHYTNGTLTRDELRPADAIHELNLAVQLDSSFALAHYDLALIYEEMNELEEAANHYTLFLEKWPVADADLPQLADARERLSRIQQSSR